MTLSLSTALYVGKVWHKRWKPVLHSFCYPVFYLSVAVHDFKTGSKLWCLSFNRFNIFSVYEKDYDIGPSDTLHSSIQARLKMAGMSFDLGQITMLTMPRILGYQFNPITIFYCFDANDELAAVFYEVSNTFGEKHSYVFEMAEEGLSCIHEIKKTFHVSPFLEREGTYRFKQKIAANKLALSIQYLDQMNLKTLSAVLGLERQKLSSTGLLLAFCRIPFLTLKVMLAIHVEALRLWLKKLPIFSKPAPPNSPVSMRRVNDTHN